MVDGLTAVLPISTPESKLLIVAQTPPPVHGQSLAVAALIQHLGLQRDFHVEHVPLALSRSSTDIGRWQPGKVWRTITAARRARSVLRRNPGTTLYYVPAPAKRGALYRDWVVLGLARPFASRLVLHWHAVGLGAWLDRGATLPERRLTEQLLGGADLAIVQAEACREDALRLRPRHIAVVRNGVADPDPAFVPRTRFGSPVEVLFVGYGCAEKGLFDALEGTWRAHSRHPSGFRLTALGPWASRSAADTFATHPAARQGIARHLGFVTTAQRNDLLRTTDVFCFPSYYPHEGQPAVILEALANDLPIVATAWRGVTEGLPDRDIYRVPPRDPEAVARALADAAQNGPAGGRLRKHYLEHFSLNTHLAAMTGALRALRRDDVPVA